MAQRDNFHHFEVCYNLKESEDKNEEAEITAGKSPENHASNLAFKSNVISSIAIKRFINNQSRRKSEGGSHRSDVFAHEIYMEKEILEIEECYFNNKTCSQELVVKVLDSIDKLGCPTKAQKQRKTTSAKKTKTVSLKKNNVVLANLLQKLVQCSDDLPQDKFVEFENLVETALGNS